MKKTLCVLLALLLLTGAPLTVRAAAAPDYTGLVSDAYYDQFDFDGFVGQYRIPRINQAGSGVAALNAAIWDELYGRYVQEVEFAYADYWPSVAGVEYSWCVYGDVLSILVTVRYMADDYNTYHIYNMSLSAGERMSDRELFQAMGTDRTGFNDLARAAMNASFDKLERDGAVDIEQLRQLRARSVADDNIARAMPYVGPGGSLRAVMWQYAFAGAECYLRSFTLDPGDTDGVLADFLERCDSEYLTRADIDGFDAKMCEYARNGVYARSGRGFNSQELREYFSQFDWYSPDIAPDQFTEAYLNDFQIKNIALVMAYEAEHGY